MGDAGHGRRTTGRPVADRLIRMVGRTRAGWSANAPVRTCASHPEGWGSTATMPQRTRPPFRADHVGSLLRPPSLLDARADHAAGRIDDAELRAREDDAIRDVVAMQKDVGLRSATDGEFRRASWHMDFIYQLDGITKAPGDLKVQFHNAEGDIEFTPAAMQVDGRLGVVETIFGEDFAFLRDRRRRRARADAEADDPVAVDGPLPRRPRRDRRVASTPTWTRSGPT